MVYHGYTLMDLSDLTGYPRISSVRTEILSMQGVCRQNLQEIRQKIRQSMTHAKPKLTTRILCVHIIWLVGDTSGVKHFGYFLFWDYAPIDCLGQGFDHQPILYIYIYIYLFLCLELVESK